MIDIKELRIGNYIKCPNNEIKEVVVIDRTKSHIDEGKLLYKNLVVCIDKEVGTINHWLQKCNPIPITEEILLSLGFKPIQLLSDPSIEVYRIGTFEIRKDRITGGYFYNDVKITSVHQLQNLYFALTGKELELKN